MRAITVLLILVSTIKSWASLEYEELSLANKVAASDYIGIVRAKDEYFDRAPLAGTDNLLPADVNISEVENIYGAPPERMYIKDLLGNSRADCCRRNTNYLVFLYRYNDEKYIPVTTFDAVFSVGLWRVRDFSEPGMAPKNVSYRALKRQILKLLEGSRN